MFVTITVPVFPFLLLAAFAAGVMVRAIGTDACGWGLTKDEFKRRCENNWLRKFRAADRGSSNDQ